MTMITSLNTTLTQSNFGEKMQAFLNDSITVFLRNELSPHLIEYNLNVDINVKVTDSSQNIMYSCDDLSINVSNSPDSNFKTENNNLLQNPKKLRMGLDDLSGIPKVNPQRDSIVSSKLKEVLSKGKGLGALFHMD